MPLDVLQQKREDFMKTTIRPGMPLDIVDADRHMKSMTYDVINKRIIIAQTVPPLTKYNLNKQISLTFVVKQNGHPVRYGVQAKVTGFEADYKLASSEVMAVGLEQTSKQSVYDLRLDYRVRPPADSNLRIEYKGEYLNIIDMSAGGFQFSIRDKDEPKIGEEFDISLIIDDHSLRLAAKAMKMAMPVSHDPALHYLGAKFIGNTRYYEQYLMKKILEIQRKLMVDGKIS